MSATIYPNPPGNFSLTRRKEILAKLVDLTPWELGSAATCIRKTLFSQGFDEAMLPPFDDIPVTYFDDVINVDGIGQLRFNTEPAIWRCFENSDRIYSITTLFRNEPEINALRRNAFSIVDFYQTSEPDALVPIFKLLLGDLSNAGFTTHLNTLRFDHTSYDPEIDGPKVTHGEPHWVIATGYDPNHSFYEVDEAGISTRREIFLVTPQGYLEVGVFGIVGRNTNSNYIVRQNHEQLPPIGARKSGMGLGLERLLLADRLLELIEH